MTAFDKPSASASAYGNAVDRSLDALLGIAQGMLSDGQLNDTEIRFLHDWMERNSSVASAWPGDVVHARVRAVLEDGIITEPERHHLVDTLQQLIGGTLAKAPPPIAAAGLVFDAPDGISYANSRFCLTGDFVYAPRDVCAAAIERRGGMLSSAVTRRLNYLVVGGLGRDSWNRGDSGQKIEKAIEYKREGAPIHLVHEDQWVASL